MSSGNKVVLGLQWGDEGKGKVIDTLSGATDIVVRCQGGANAGHTVVVDGRSTVLHLLPSGALHEGATCVIGNGVVVDLVALASELDDLGPAGEELTKRLMISDRAHLVLPVHKALDAAFEQAKGESKVGTTLRGIGPTYADKVARLGVRSGVLTDPARFTDAVVGCVRSCNRILQSLGAAQVDPDDILSSIEPYRQRAAPLVADTVAFLQRADATKKRMLFEGAQGVMLDIDHGTYPYVTSSNTGTGGILTGSGLGPRALGEIIGIVKAYTTRVGEGPFVTELHGDKGEELRQRGGEFGATTGRPRRCGWLDLVVVGYACRLSGVDTIALTKLDVLSGEEELPVCVGYRLDGQVIDTVPADLEDLARAEPVYETLPGWSEDIAGVCDFHQLPQAAQQYVQFIEDRASVRVGYIGTGPGREAIILRP
jgi:adenylosuccinate synthase